jgi:hypothetical protein
MMQRGLVCLLGSSVIAFIYQTDKVLSCLVDLCQVGDPLPSDV